MNRGNSSNSLMSLLGGAALGAVAMYLMDPESGRRRRENLGETAGDAIGRTGDALGTAWERVSEGALAAGSAVAASNAYKGTRHALGGAYDSSREAVEGAGERAGEFGHDLWDRLRGLGRSVSSRASGASEAASDRGRAAASRVGSWFGYEPEPRTSAGDVATYTLGAAATLAAGVAAMYFLDPQAGRRRRAVAGDKVAKIVNDTGGAFRQAGQLCQDWMNRSKGTAHEIRRTVASGGPVTAEQLLQRVRSHMGHVVTNASAIQVMSDAEGNVTLTGRVPASEQDRLLRTVKAVPGVTQIVNRLEVVDTADQVNQGGSNPMQSPGVPQM